MMLVNSSALKKLTAPNRVVPIGHAHCLARLSATCALCFSSY
jgi:hypothetical protein